MLQNESIALHDSAHTKNMNTKITHPFMSKKIIEDFGVGLRHQDLVIHAMKLPFVYGRLDSSDAVKLYSQIKTFYEEGILPQYLAYLERKLNCEHPDL